MIPRFTRASIPSQTVTPRNLTLTILSVGPNHLGSYLINPSVNTNVSPAKNHLYSPTILSTKRLWNLAIHRKTLVCGCQAILPWTRERAAPCNKVILRLPFRCDVTYKTRLQLTNLSPISYWHEFLDIVFFCKAVNNLVFIDSEALPATRQSTRSTRSSSSNSITYIPKRSRPVTYLRSFFIRACRTWDVLSAESRTSLISLASFKRSLFQYYKKTLDLYDVYDIRTWRTICPRCNMARTLLCSSTCCF